MRKQNENPPKQENLFQRISSYEKSSTKRSLLQIGSSVVPFFLLWYLAYLSLSVSYVLTLAVGMIASGFMIRIFIIFHDCCHQSFFKNRKANHILGTFLGVLTLHPYLQWKHDHSVHHATSSNLAKRGTGDIWILTVDEYISSTFWKRLGYRLYRNPFVLFFLGPIFSMILLNRINRKGAKRKERLNTYLTNAILLLIAVALSFAIGWKEFLMIQLPIFYLAGMAGLWLFYVQHQFEDSYFEKEEDWNYVKAAVDGSSYYKLPKVLQWITGNIGFHHVHHLSPRVPNYYLEKVHEKTPDLQTVTTITLISSLKALKFRLWDEQNKRFVSFGDIKHLLTQMKKKTKLAS